MGGGPGCASKVKLEVIFCWILCSEEFNQNLAEISEPLQITEVRDKIFHKVLGEDGHGYCKTYGTSVPRNAVYGQCSDQSQTSSSSTINEITRQVREVTQQIEQRLSVEIERRLSEKFMDHLQLMEARMDLFESKKGTNRFEQVPNATPSARLGGQEEINSTRLTATSQDSVANDCGVAEKLSHGCVLGRGGSVKGKHLSGSTAAGQQSNGGTSAGQRLCNKG